MLPTCEHLNTNVIPPRKLRSRGSAGRGTPALLRNAEWGQWSDRQIAKHCSVDDKTVAKVRAELSADFRTREGDGASADFRTSEPETRKFERGGKVHEQRVEKRKTMPTVASVFSAALRCTGGHVPSSRCQTGNSNAWTPKPLPARQT